MAARIKKGDNVVVITGRDKGRSGEVIRVMPKEGRALVPLDEVDAAHKSARLLRHDLEDLAGLALVAACQDDDLVALLDLRSHYRTSGASEMIFMWFLARNSRGTGPKMRVPTGSF